MSNLSIPAGVLIGAPFVFRDTIDSNTNNYDLYDEMVAAGWNEQVPVDAFVTINGGVTVGSTSTSTPAFNIDALPDDSIVFLTNNGRIFGKPGNGGAGVGVTNGCSPTGGSSGADGGPALRVRHATTLVNSELWGGGGGGGGGGSALGCQEIDPYVGCEQESVCGGGGGGGQGSNGSSGGSGGTNFGCHPSRDGNDGFSGSESSTGSGGASDSGLGSTSGAGGNGGGPGQNGSSGQSGSGTDSCGCSDFSAGGKSGGSAGSSVDGHSLVTYDTSGDIRGPQVN